MEVKRFKHKPSDYRFVTTLQKLLHITIPLKDVLLKDSLYSLTSYTNKFSGLKTTELWCNHGEVALHWILNVQSEDSMDDIWSMMSFETVHFFAVIRLYLQ
jgi:hypothetical protein